jgi:hypothetical protein
VLEKARIILAREQTRQQDTARAAVPAREPAQKNPSLPGCGAWWAF